MNVKKKPEPADAEQSARFVKTAHDVEAIEEGNDFDIKFSLMRIKENKKPKEKKQVRS